ncbi:acyl transferase/acyl hydrolase/lysophospholipase [Phycomyces nitens]|nr:acyl transferase/acyl hydrolase/lysophospholipase [Phycomyces nitens]
MMEQLVTATDPHQSTRIPTKADIASAVQFSVTPIVNATKSITLDSGWKWPNKMYDKVCGITSDPKAQYTKQLENATHYEEWAEAATILDELEGKHVLSSSDISVSLARLYSRTRVGTKHLISDYIDEVVDQFNWLCDEPSDDPELDLKAKHDFFMNIRQSFGRTAILLSGGGTLGTNHMGVLKCLHSARLLPRIMSGASSGSLMASFICTRTDEEIVDLFKNFSDVVRLDLFEKEEKPETPWMRLHRLFTSGQLYDINILIDAIRANLGDYTFQEAFNRTRWILNITVSSSTNYDMPQLLNYLTAPDVVIWSAVAASCSVPFFYTSSPLYAKDKSGKIVPWNPVDQLYIDGSVENDLPMTRLSELFNVNHFIVCQVNPHVIPFLQKDNKPPSKVRQAANFCMHLAKTEIQHRCTQLTELGMMPHALYKVQAIMSQKYSGDITIIPDIGYTDYLKVLSNPTPDLILEAIVRGERATWPKMSIIKHHLQIELTIDAILYRLRLRRLSEVAVATKETDPQRQPVRSTSTRPLLETRALSHLQLQKIEIVPSATRAMHLTETKRTELPAVVLGDSQVAQQAESDQQGETQKEDQENTIEIISKEKTRERKVTKKGLLMTVPDE